MHAFSGVGCQILAFGLVSLSHSSMDHDHTLPNVDLLLRAKGTGQARYLIGSVPAEFGRKQLERLVDACNENGDELMHVFAGSECQLMKHVE